MMKKRAMLSFYKRFIGKGDLCFDIGANIGERTEVFLQLGSSVIAVEPQNTCYEILEYKFGYNKRVKILKCAAGSEDKEEQLMICDETNECSTFSRDFIDFYTKISGLHWKKGELVQIKTLENLATLYGMPKLCKIDVEGYESEVLLGMKQPVKYIAFEFNRPLLKDTAKSLAILSEIGNYHCNFIQYEIMDLVLDEWLPVDEFQQTLEQIITPEILTGEIIAVLF